MGPSLIFDKSALQALNPDEAMWLDNFYLANITPMFFVETLADLEKEVRKGKAPEELVGNIANKTPENGCVNTNYENLLFGELTGQGKVELAGRPAVFEGQAVKLGNETGVIFRPSPEAEAFQRWQKHQFLDIERTIAKKWREGLKSITREDSGAILREVFGSLVKPQTLEEVKHQVDSVMDSAQRREVLIFGLKLLGIAPEFQASIIQRWEMEGKGSLREFAPYFVHVFSVNLFFYLGTAAGLFSAFPHPLTHGIDVAYLYYLPFCMIFVSKVFYREVHDKNIRILFNKYLKQSKKPGIPQGTPLSPFMANLYLINLDRILEKEPGIKHFRYIDDLVVFCDSKSRAHRVYKKVCHLFKELELTIHPLGTEGKTQIDLFDKGTIDILGVIYKGKKLLIKPKKYKTFINEVITPLQFKATLDPRVDLHDAIEELIDDLNYEVNGWASAYSFCDVEQSFIELDKKLFLQFKRLLERFNVDEKRKNLYLRRLPKFTLSIKKKNLTHHAVV